MTARRVSVLGAGTMGRGIAQVAAQAGFDVALYDVAASVLAEAAKAIETTLSKGVELGKVSQEARSASLRRLHPTSDLSAAASEADLIIEAVPEDLTLKRRVFSDVEPLAPVPAILATNTSSLSVTAIAEAAQDPGRVVGMHFFNPPHLMRLVEVVRGVKTRATTLEATVALARTMGKEPIVVADSPGFATSRLGLALGLEAIRMLESGVASAADIDKAMELGYNHPMGPLRLSDLVGLDVRLAIAEHLHRELRSEAFRPPPLLKKMVNDGKKGRKSGQGFYSYLKE